SPDVRRESGAGAWMESLGYARADGSPWQHTATFRVDLTGTEDVILGRIKKLKRYHIRRAATRGVWIDSANGPSNFAQFYSMYRATGDRNSFRVLSERRMRGLWEESGKGGWGRVFLSRAPDGEPLSGMLAIAPGSRCHYLFGASLPRCRELHPNELLHWEVMRWARKRGCAIYDLEGVAGRVSKEHPLYGNYLFKSGFGGDYVELAGEYERVLRPRTYRVLHWAISQLRGGKGQAAAPEGERHA
ncbi:MAG: peptidoglycan bridge formation glycyltransferase FemA/FemB family protein, partial [Deltaproteobacteria bacterium]|nr:peptidoglycan bridge formation glycyltransferase FemA/FemB family protein [Deltaproteobacteria bacterium]